MSLADDLKKQTKNFRTKKIDYQVDTLRYDEFTLATPLGYYHPDKGTITINYGESSKWMRNLEEKLPWIRKEINDQDVILYHEQKHRSNADKGFQSKNISVSPEQYYKLCMANEISANMAELVYLREEYIKTGDIHLFDKDGNRFSFYKEAVQKGEIDPLSSDPKDFEKDMSLIMDGTQEMWMNRFAKIYSADHIDMTEWYLKYGSGNFKENESEYQKQLDIAYTIGGVNFKQYRSKGLEMPVYKSMERDYSRLEYLRKLKEFPFTDNMSFEQYNNLLQHLYIASNIKAISDSYLAQMNVKSIDAMSSEQRKAYTKTIQKSMEQANSALKRDKCVKDNINFGMNVALRGEKERTSIPSENEANYQVVLKQIYNINGIDHYSLLHINPREKMPIEKSLKVKAFEAIMDFAKHDVDKVSWWAEIFSKDVGENDGKDIVKDYLKNYPKWSKDKRVSEVQYEEILDFDKPVITGRPIRQGKFEAVRRSKSTDFKTADEALRASKEASTPENLDRAAYLKSLSGRTQQDTTARVSQSFSRMRDSKSSMELMLLRRQMGR